MSSFFHIDIAHLIQTFGILGLSFVVFAETGLFFGFFFPGDSLLFTAGVLASQGFLNIWIMVPFLIMSAILGDSFGYWFGAKIGPKIFSRDDSFFFRKHHIERTHAFYMKHGSKAIFLARFVPVVRTFAPILAGVGGMPYKTFVRYNSIGGFAWAGGVTLLGYFFGKTIPHIGQYLTPIIVTIIVVSSLPIIFEILKNREKS